ncbi:MAG: glycoside hydrolase family 3 N-terminal domain-containing protein [Longimicrobiales bacterium]
MAAPVDEPAASAPTVADTTPPPAVVDEAPPPDPDPAPTVTGPVAEPGTWTESVLAEMTLEEKVGQMIMPWVIGDFAPKGSDSHDRTARYVEDGIGGVIMSVGSPTEVAAKLNDLQRHAKYPLLVAADLETGAGFRFRGAVQMPGIIELGGATDFPSLMAVGATGDPQLAYEMGRVTALEARAVGVHVPFAPVLDVNNNPDNPIINVRSFGEDPDMVGRMGAAFVRGVQDHGAIATGKHFPGHGDTGTDSHLALPTIRHDRARMDSVELRPFQAAIDAGMGAVMTAHITTPSLNGGNGDPATLSAAVLTGLLREEMGFGGLLFTDAMDMAAISGRLGAGEAAVQAVVAGADVILMPPAVRPARDGIVAAVRSGRISEERIDRSVRALLRTKEALGLHEERTVSLDDVVRTVGLPAHQAVADEIARRSITLLKNDGDLLPLRGTPSANVLSVTYRRSSDVLAGRYFNRRLRQTYRRLRTVELDRDAGSALWDGVLRQARNSALTVVSTYVTAVSYSGSVALPDEVSEFVKELARRDIPHVVISFGNPYLLGDFPDVRAYMLAWSGSEASQRAAAGALFGDFAVRGRSPTGAPPLFRIGDGLMLPARTAARP